MRLKYLYIGLIAVTGLSACSKDSLDETNTDPKAATEEQMDPNFLFTDAQLTFSNTGYSQLLYQSTAMQGLASTFGYYGNGDKYVNTNGSAGYQALIFTNGYTALSRLNQAIKISESRAGDEYTNLIASSKIMRALIFQRLTDTYGDIPYSEALSAQEGNVTPVYDRQQNIYMDMLMQLDSAVNQLNEQTTQLSGDLFYGGNVAQWRRFGYSLMLRVAMRLTKIDPATAQEWAERAAAGGTFVNATDNAIVYTDPSSGETNNATTNALKTADDFREVRWSQTLINYLRRTSDPRLSVIGEIPLEGLANNQNQTLTGNTDSTVQLGLPNGFDLGGGATDIRRSAGYPGGTGSGSNTAPLGLYSRPRVNVYLKDDGANFILSYAETEFLLAEAAVRGWNVNGDAATHYANGLTGALEAMAQLDASAAISSATIASYVSAHPLDNANALQMINEQYWLTDVTTFNFIESWLNWKRSGFPTLTPVVYPGNITSGRIPRRMIYPTTETTLNPNNYQAAVANLSGGDLLTSRVWWDAN